MATNEKLGNIIINEGKDVLIKEIVRMLPHTTITLLGPSGSGKTTLIEEVAKDSRLGIDKFVTIRLQGVSSEDFRLPILVEETATGIKETEVLNLEIGNKKKISKSVEFAKIGIFKEIMENPEKKYLLFFDEILRAEASVAPLLFELLERRFDGEKMNNLYIMTAANYGEEYISQIDYSDSALRRRQIFIEWVPNKDDIEEFMKEKNYHPIIRELVELLPMSNIIDHEPTKELEQDTQLGSWHLLNCRWNEMVINEKLNMDYSKCKLDIVKFGSYFFTEKTKKEMINKLTVLEQINVIDIQKEILENEGLTTPGYIIKDRKGKKFDVEGKENELLIRTKYYIKDEVLKNFGYIEKYGDKVFKLFLNREVLLAAWFTEMNRAYDSIYDSVEANEYKSKLAKTMFMICTKLTSKDSNDEKMKQAFTNFTKGMKIASSRK